MPTQASSPLVTPGTNVGQALIVPTTNPFIPADLRTLLNSRTGDNPNIIGSGATEPFLMRWRTLGAGLRKAAYENNVTQYMVGARGELVADWTWEAYLSEGRTKITNGQSGNIDTNRLLATLAAADGGASLCAGGVNPFGRQPLSAACTDYLEVSNTLTTEFKQTIGQAFVSGEVARLPAGAMSAVLGAEFRNFEYSLDPGAASGPISGFNVQNAAGGRNSFKDLFGELQMPLARRAPMAESLDLSLAVRSSESKAQDPVRNLTTPKERSNAFALNLTWQPTADVRARGSLQKSVRAPNFGELFDGGGSAPQYYDPCSVTSKGRTTGANAAQLSALLRCSRCRSWHGRRRAGRRGCDLCADPGHAGLDQPGRQHQPEARDRRERDPGPGLGADRWHVQGLLGLVRLLPGRREGRHHDARHERAGGRLLQLLRQQLDLQRDLRALPRHRSRR